VLGAGLGGAAFGEGFGGLTGAAIDHSKSSEPNVGSVGQSQSQRKEHSHGQSGEDLSGKEAWTRESMHEAQLFTPPPEPAPPGHEHNHYHREAFGQGPFGQVPLNQGPFDQKSREEFPPGEVPPPQQHHRPPADRAPLTDPHPSTSSDNQLPKQEYNHEVGSYPGKSKERMAQQNETEKTSFSGATTQAGRTDNEDRCERLRKEIEKVRTHVQKIQTHLSWLEEEFKQTCKCKEKEFGGISSDLPGVGAVGSYKQSQGGDVQSLLSGIFGR
jgi:hypothetical protein